MMLLVDPSNAPVPYQTDTSNWQLVILLCAFFLMCVLIAWAHAWRDVKIGKDHDHDDS